MTTSRPTMNYELIKRATSRHDIDLLCILYQNQSSLKNSNLDIHIFKLRLYSFN